MTVSYQYEVASSTSGGFTRLLFMWRGSLYKLIYRELLLFAVAFGLLSAAYRNLFSEPQKRLFEKVVVYCETFITFIPLSFVLGFYVAYVAGRWWQQYMAIPWPDKVMHSLALYVGGNDMQGRMIRRSLMRYLNLSLVLVLRSISSAVKRRFPTMDHIVEAGFMSELELEMFQAVPNLEFNTYWIPCTWFIALLKDTKKSNRITDSQGLQTIIQEFNEFRSKCGLLWSYDWISIPLVYTQVVTLATYSFFLAALVGRQYIDETTSLSKKQFQMEIDTYVPLFTILQFFFYMGLLKVAEQLINPFGDDDEDFELNWLIDRHMKVRYCELLLPSTLYQCWDTTDEPYRPPQVLQNFWNTVRDRYRAPAHEEHGGGKSGGVVHHPRRGLVSTVSYLGVDTLMSRYPPLVKDKYFDDLNIILPYTGAAFAYKKKTYRGSVHNMMVPENQQSMFLPEISEEDDDDHDSCKRGSSLNKTSSSFSNLNAASSPAAGIWRKNSENTGKDPCQNVEANFQKDELKRNVSLGKFNAKAPWKTQSNPLIIPVSSSGFQPMDLQNWCSQSTLDSVDSIQPNTEDSPGPKLTDPFDESFQKMELYDISTVENDDNSIEASHSTIIRRNNDSFVDIGKANARPKILKYNSTGNVASSLRNSFSKRFKQLTGDDRTKMKKLLGRRQSSSSGQWKGVRWKPVIDDSAGDTWSDNAYRRPSYEMCKSCYSGPSIASESISLAPSHMSSTESVTSSFQSINSGNQFSESAPVAVVSARTTKSLKSKSLAGVSEEGVIGNTVCPKDNLKTCSLPNICIGTLEPKSLKTSLNSSFSLPIEDQPLHPVVVLKKAYSTSPRTFPKLQDTITEENETK